MKLAIQLSDSEHWLTRSGKWTPNVSEAMLYKSSNGAYRRVDLLKVPTLLRRIQDDGTPLPWKDVWLVEPGSRRADSRGFFHMSKGADFECVGDFCDSEAKAIARLKSEAERTKRALEYSKRETARLEHEFNTISRHLEYINAIVPQ